MSSFTAPGGTLSDDMTCTDFCLFKAQEDMETMQAYAQVNTSAVASLCHVIKRRSKVQLGQTTKHALCFLSGLQ